MKRDIVIGLALAAAFVHLTAVSWSRETRMADLDGDGYKEAEIFYGPQGVLRALVDGDRDGRRETVIYYKDGLRDRASVDSDGDRRADVWVSYYRGVAWKVAEDQDRDGRPDRWYYLKDGFVYKWEEDRNRDGRPDFRTTYEPDGKSRVFVQRFSDDDLDGIFENRSGITGARREAAQPRMVAEAILR